MSGVGGGQKPVVYLSNKTVSFPPSLVGESRGRVEFGVGKGSFLGLFIDWLDFVIMFQSKITESLLPPFFSVFLSLSWTPWSYQKAFPKQKPCQHNSVFAVLSRKFLITCLDICRNISFWALKQSLLEGFLPW